MILKSPGDIHNCNRLIIESRANYASNVHFSAWLGVRPINEIGLFLIDLLKY